MPNHGNDLDHPTVLEVHYFHKSDFLDLSNCFAADEFGLIRGELIKLTKPQLRQLASESDQHQEGTDSE